MLGTEFFSEKKKEIYVMSRNLVHACESTSNKIMVFQVIQIVKLEIAVSTLNVLEPACAGQIVLDQLILDD